MKKIGEILLEKGWATEDHLAEALAYKNSSQVLLGKILMAIRYINQESLNRALELQKLQEGKLLGECLVEMNVLTKYQLKRAISIQKKSKSYLGELLVELGYVSQEKIDEALMIQARDVHQS